MIAKQNRKQAQVDEACGGSDGGLDSQDDKPPPVSSEEEVDAQAVVAQSEGEVEMVRDARRRLMASILVSRAMSGLGARLSRR